MPVQLTRMWVLATLTATLTACSTRAVDREAADAHAVPLEDMSTISASAEPAEEPAAGPTPEPESAYGEPPAQASYESDADSEPGPEALVPSPYEKPAIKKPVKKRVVAKKYKPKKSSATTASKRNKKSAPAVAKRSRQELRQELAAGQIAADTGSGQEPPAPTAPAAESVIAMDMDAAAGETPAAASTAEMGVADMTNNPLGGETLPVPEAQTEAEPAQGFDWIFWAMIAAGLAAVLIVVRLVRGRKPRSLVYHS